MTGKYRIFECFCAMKTQHLVIVAYPGTISVPE